MGKKNQYSFSKRQREIKKKKKAEEKRARKMAKADGDDPDAIVHYDEFGNPVDADGNPIDLSELEIVETEEERPEGEGQA